MFDIGFWEIFLVIIVALIVVGPERLPGLARKAGLWVAKIKGFVTSVKSDIDRELAAEELKRVVNDQEGKQGLYQIIEETRQAVEEAGKTLKEAEQDFMLGTITDEEVQRKQAEILEQIRTGATSGVGANETADTSTETKSITQETPESDPVKQGQAVTPQPVKTETTNSSQPQPTSVDSTTEKTTAGNSKVTEHDNKG